MDDIMLIGPSQLRVATTLDLPVRHCVSKGRTQIQLKTGRLLLQGNFQGSSGEEHVQISLPR